ncbi:hypothetical protein [Yinghuangia sp. YIM S09857]|uniref:phage tail tube protein n=1 Tax=Yinghuangia sp. YIM S09857 TaxID=3436929 RepID=UPI003F52D255
MAFNNTAAIRFAPRGQMYVASLASNPVFPTNPTADLGPEWLALGYASSDGVELTPAIETQALEAWQSATPVMHTVTAASLQVKATLLQTDPATTSLYFGAEWEKVTDAQGQEVPGVFRLPIASNPTLAELAMIVQWGDAKVSNMLVIPRGMVSSRDALKLVRADAQSLGVTYDALDSSGVLGYVLSNDPQMAPTTPIVLPTLAVAPTSVAKGGTASLTGSNWGSGTAPTVAVTGPSTTKVTVGTVTLTSGAISATVTVAADAPTGTYTIQATGTAGTKSVTLAVT